MAVVAYLLRVDLRRRWRALLLLALLVTVMVGAVLTAAAGVRRTQSSFDRYLAEVRPADALVTFEGSTIDAATVEAIPGVDAAVGFRWFSTFPKGGRDGLYFIPMFVPTDARVPVSFNRSRLVAGRRPDPTKPREIALGEHTAQRLGVEVGDTFPMASFSPEQAGGGFEDPQGPTVDLEVVGILRTAGDITANQNDTDPAFLTPAFAETYGDRIAPFGEGLMVFTTPGTSLERVGKAIAPLGDTTFETSFGLASYRAQADPTLDAMATGLRVVAVILALAGGVVIVQALARAATDRLPGHDGIRELGAPLAARLTQMALPSLLAVTVGVVAGGALSVALSPFVLWGLAARAEPDTGVRVDAPVLVVGVLGALVLLTLAVAGVTALTLRRSRQHDRGPARASATVAKAAGWGGSVPVITGLRLALERGRGARTTPVVAAALAAALGGVGVMATTVFAGSLHHAVTTPSVYGWMFDGVLVGSDNGDDFADNAATAASLTADPSFTAVAEIANDVEIVVDGTPERTWVLKDLKGHSPFVTVRGREAIGPDEVQVGGDTLAKLGLDLGDQLAVSAGGPDRTLTIVGVVTLPVTDDGGTSSVGYAMRREAADALGFSGDCSQAQCSRFLTVTAAPGVDAAEAVAPHLIDGVTYVRPAPPAQLERLRAVDGLPRAVAVALGVVAIVAVSYAASATVRRRSRDLAMLRVWGLQARQLRWAVTIQVAVLAIGGAVVGVILGVAIGRGLWTAVADSASIPVVFAFPAAAVVVVPSAIAVCAQVGASFARRSAGRVRPAVALRAG